MRAVIALPLLAAAALACNEPLQRGQRSNPTASPGEGERAATRVAPPTAPIDATALLERFECNRCHDGGGVAPAPAARHCVTCHREIHAGTFDAPADAIAAWQQRIVSLRWVPSLAGARALRRDWVAAYLLEPRDLRPDMLATMPRLAISEAEAAQLAAHLVPDERLEPGYADADAERGQALYAELGCASCHAFSGAPVEPGLGTATAARALAPDLAHARRRLQPGRVVDWILAPASIAPAATMPAYPIAPGDARALAAFIMTVPLELTPAPSIPARLPVLSREVSWAEVSARVFRKICWHCHSQPDYARGDGGPGNTGGFGFAPRALDLSSYEGAAAGARGDDGRRHSVFAAGPDGTPLMVRQLMARHAEVAGQSIPDVRGMPLGLPPLSLEDIQLVDSWIAQGRPR